jgi:hypothetical protein
VAEADAALPAEAPVLTALETLQLKHWLATIELRHLDGDASVSAEFVDRARAVIESPETADPTEAREILVTAISGIPQFGSTQARRSGKSSKTWLSKVASMRAAVAASSAEVTVHASLNIAGGPKTMGHDAAAEMSVMDEAVKANLGWWERWAGDTASASSADASAPVAPGSESWQFGLARLCAEAYGDGTTWRQNVFDPTIAAGVEPASVSSAAPEASPGGAASLRPSSPFDGSSLDAAAGPIIETPTRGKRTGSSRTGSTRTGKHTSRKHRMRIATERARWADEEATRRRRRRALAMARALEVLRGDCRVEAGDGRAWALHSFLLRSRSADLADVVPSSAVAMAEPGVLPFVLPVAFVAAAGPGSKTGIILFSPGPALQETVLAAFSGVTPRPEGASSTLAFGHIDHRSSLFSRSRFARHDSADHTEDNSRPILTTRESCDGYSDDGASDAEDDFIQAGTGDDSAQDEAADQDPTSIGARHRFLVAERLREAANADAAADAENNRHSVLSAAITAVEAEAEAVAGHGRHSHHHHHRTMAHAAAPAPSLFLPASLAGRAAQEFVAYLYTGRCSISGSVVVALARAAHQYTLPLLLASCESHLLGRCNTTEDSKVFTDAAKELYMPRLLTYAAVIRSSAIRTAVAAGDWASVFPTAAAGARQSGQSTRGGASTLTATASAAGRGRQHTGHARASVPESPVVGLAGMSGGAADVPDFSLDGDLPAVPAGASDTASEVSSARSIGDARPPTGVGGIALGGAASSSAARPRLGGSASSGSAWGRGPRAGGGGAVSLRTGSGAAASARVSLADRLVLEQLAEEQRQDARRQARWVASQGASWAAGVATAGIVAPVPLPTDTGGHARATRLTLVPAGVRIAAASAVAAGPEEDSSDSDDNSVDSNPFD